MATRRLKLAHEWKLADRIGGGGFGQVYAVSSPGQSPAVAKLVPKAPGAQRELLFVNLDGVRNIVPVIDSGETADSWVMVMPKADKSLRQHLGEAGGTLDVAGAVPILADLATALVDLDGKIVHRDLKPENVLLLNGRWCLADFGISRYAEATTAPDTQKFALSMPYAAPERWRAERATTATDVYSLGVIAFELLTGSPPFRGPSQHDFREQHLHSNPPPLSGAPASLQSLVEECLYKAPRARPPPANTLARLQRVATGAASGGLAKLQQANLEEVGRQRDSARRSSEAQSEAERRNSLVSGAKASLQRIADGLREAIVGAAPAASFQRGRDGGWNIQLKTAQLEFLPMMATHGWRAQMFDVVTHAAVSIRIPPGESGYEGRSHALWYCDAQSAGRYQWFETAFMVMPLIAQRGRQDPFALEPADESAKALGRSMARFQAAWPFTPLDVSDLSEFIDRWANWFADAAVGRLEHPRQMPERNPEGSWRQS